jgi:outer membrane protein, heavy metal efflux system
MKKNRAVGHWSLAVTCLLFCSVKATGQLKTDTLTYTIKQAEQVFLQHNLPLLAEKLNIDQADAKILQAKVWPNPTFSLGEVQLYKNATTDDIPPLFGNFWRDRNFTLQLEQLIYTAGKRKKNIDLEIKNKELAQHTFKDLLQALKAEFRQTATEVIYIQGVQKNWEFQLLEVNKLLKAQQSQLKEGHIAEVELYRLKALQISLQGEINSLNEQLTEAQKTLKTLMFINPESAIVIIDNTDDVSIERWKSYRLRELISLSENNALLQSARTQIKVNQAQLAIEKANRIPDITLNANYDRNGSVMLNFVGLGFSMDLPFFNRNKGNIRVAQYELEKSMLMEKHKVSELNNAIVKTWTDLNRAIALYESIDKDYLDKLNTLTKSIAKNFSQHNISLIEFLDFFESFRESKEKYYEAIKNINVKKEDLNYLVGSEL